MKCMSPHESAGLVSSWGKTQPAIGELLKEESQLQFQNTNLPVRLFFSKYLKFNQDKYEQPQIFCWPGASMIGLSTNKVALEMVMAIFERHKALFVDSIEGNVYATIQEGVSAEQLDKTFNDFYSWNSLYDMVRQWTIEPGPFVYDLRWLTRKHTPEEAKNWVCRTFVNVFGHHPDKFKIL